MLGPAYVCPWDVIALERWPLAPSNLQSLHWLWLSWVGAVDPAMATVLWCQRGPVLVYHAWPLARNPADAAHLAAFPTCCSYGDSKAPTLWLAEWHWKVDVSTPHSPEGIDKRPTLQSGDQQWHCVTPQSLAYFVVCQRLATVQTKGDPGLLDSFQQGWSGTTVGSPLQQVEAQHRRPHLKRVHTGEAGQIPLGR